MALAACPARGADLATPPITRSTSALSFRVALDDSAYLPGQPIYLLATVRNVSDSTFDDFGGAAGVPLGLRPLLYRGTRRIPDHYWELRGAWIFGPGPKLEPGATFCCISNLLEGYGTDPIDIPNGMRYHAAPGLPPGRYRFVLDLVAHLPYRSTADKLETEVAFTVLPPSRLTPLDVRTLRRLESAAPRWPRTRTLEEWSRMRRDGLDRSRYVPVLTRIFMPGEEAVRMADFALDLARSGRSPVLVAGLLAQREESLRGNTGARLAWLGTIGSAFADGSLQCLIQSWERMAKLSLEEEEKLKRVPPDLRIRENRFGTVGRRLGDRALSVPRRLRVRSARAAIGDTDRWIR